MRSLAVCLALMVVALLGSTQSEAAALLYPAFGAETPPARSELAVTSSSGSPLVGQNGSVAVSLTFSRTQDGAWVGTGNLRNLLDRPLNVEIGAVGYGDGDNHPLVDAPTLFVEDMAPGSTRPISIDVPSRVQASSWNWMVQTTSSSGPALVEIDVGTSRKLLVAPSLVGTIDALRSADGGEWLLRVAAEGGTTIRRGPTPPNILGRFEPFRDTITISNSLDRSSAWVRATVLSHELQHVADLAAGASPNTPAGCFEVETAAFQRQARTWMSFWRGNLPPGADPIHSEMNAVAMRATQDPQRFADELTSLYASECGPPR